MAGRSLGHLRLALAGQGRQRAHPQGAAGRLRQQGQHLVLEVADPACRDDIGAQVSCRPDRRRAHPAGAADHDDALAGQVQPGRQRLLACPGLVIGHGSFPFVV